MEMEILYVKIIRHSSRIYVDYETYANRIGLLSAGRQKLLCHGNADVPMAGTLTRCFLKVFLFPAV